MGLFSHHDSDQTQANNEYQEKSTSSEHKASLGHEALGGAAAYEASKAYEKHVAKNGKPASHAEAKELLAGFSGAFVDREVETKGLNSIDKEKAKYHAKQQGDSQIAQDY
ncbi:putative phosphoglycerate mutase family protein [Phellopilus nigrolimitatus]|nr:putative phosphoglycerate mutase family protein [Phellopilus nigrolimitatus]